MPKPIPHYCVAQVWMNGVKTVQTFHTDTDAQTQARACAELYKGNLVYFGTLIAQSTSAEDQDDFID